MKSSTHAEFKDYIDNQGFVINFDKYGAEYDDSLITDEQMIDYIINEDSVVQIEDVLMRPTQSFTYLITMNSSELSWESYEFLKDGYYEITKMNRFVIDQSGGRALNLFEFDDETPSGFDEYPDNPTAGSRCDNPVVEEGCPPTKMFGESCTRVYDTPGHYFAESDTWGPPRPKKYCCKHTFWFRHHCDTYNPDGTLG